MIIDKIEIVLTVGSIPMETTTEETRAEAMTTTSQKTSTTTGISEHHAVLNDSTFLRAI